MDCIHLLDAGWRFSLADDEQELFSSGWHKLKEPGPKLLVELDYSNLGLWDFKEDNYWLWTLMIKMFLCL